MRFSAAAVAAAFVTSAAASGPHPLSAWPGVISRVPLPWENNHHHHSTDDDAVQVTLSVSPSVLTGYGQWVTVTVGAAPWAANDTIALYSPPPSSDDLKGRSPVTYFNSSACKWSEVPSHLQAHLRNPTFNAATGDCSIDAFVVNPGDDSVWAYTTVPDTADLAGSEQPLGHHDALGFSNVITFESYYLPIAPRLTGTGKEGEMLVTWSANGDSSAQPRLVFWPVNNTGLSQIVYTSSSVTYTPSDLCGEPATTKGYTNPGYFHSALLTGLVPGKSYTYSFGDNNALFPSNLTFKAFPKVGDTSVYPVTVAAWGDMGHDSSSIDGSQEHYFQPPAPTTMRLVGNLVDSGEAQVLLHYGDISYSRGYASEWRVFDFNWASGAVMKGQGAGIQGGNAATGKVPYLVSSGNHEQNFASASPDGSFPLSFFNTSDSGGECGVVVEKRYPQPWSSTLEPWFAVPYGPIMMISMNTEISFLPGSKQYAWIKATLEGIDRTVFPFVLYAGHRPMYCNSDADDGPASDQAVGRLLRQYIEPLLMNAGGNPVDIALWGHHHSYQRQCAVFNETCVQHSQVVNGQRVFQSPKAPVQMLIGTAGASFSTNVMPQTPLWNELTLFHYGFSTLKFHNDTALEFTFVTDDNGAVGDHFFILK